MQTNCGGLWCSIACSPVSRRTASRCGDAAPLVASHRDVVEEAQPDFGGRRPQWLGDRGVLSARLHRPRRMIVREGDRHGNQPQRFRETSRIGTTVLVAPPEATLTTRMTRLPPSRATRITCSRRARPMRGIARLAMSADDRTSGRSVREPPEPIDRTRQRCDRPWPAPCPHARTARERRRATTRRRHRSRSAGVRPASAQTGPGCLTRAGSRQARHPTEPRPRR